MSIEATDCHTQLGKTLEGWSFVESSLCSLFIKLTQMHPPLGRKLFYSGAGFGSRVKMLRIAMECVNVTGDGMREFWHDAIAIADRYSSFRNLVVHGDILFIGFEKSKYHGQHIILQGREFWKADPDPKDVVVQDQLATADQHFRLLASCMMTVLGGGAPPPTECRELITLLPTQPHLAHLSSTDLARFSQLKSTSFER